jgi:hypothetical protein
MDDIEQRYPGNTIGKDITPTSLWDDQMAAIGDIISEHEEWRVSDAIDIERMTEQILGQRHQYGILLNEVERLRDEAASTDVEPDVPEYVEWQDFDPDA